jgi:hypothetical protein
MVSKTSPLGTPIADIGADILFRRLGAKSRGGQSAELRIGNIESRRINLSRLRIGAYLGLSQVVLDDLLDKIDDASLQLGLFNPRDALVSASPS